MGKPLPLAVGAAGTPSSGDLANAVISGTISAVGPQVPFEFFGPFNLVIHAVVNTTLTTTAGSTTATLASSAGLAAGNAIKGANIPAGTTIGTLTGTTAGLALPFFTVSGSVNTSNRVVSGLSYTTGLRGASCVGTGIPAGTSVTSVVSNAVASNGVVDTTFGSVSISAQPTVNAVEPLTFGLTGNAISSGVDIAALFTGAAVDFSATILLEKSFDGGLIWIPVQTYSTGTPVVATISEAEKGVAYRLNCTSYSSGTIYYRMSATGQGALSLSTSSVI